MMEHFMRLLASSLDALELSPEEVTEAEIEHPGFNNWCVLINGTYVFFEANLYEPYTTVTPYEADELAGMYEAKP